MWLGKQDGDRQNKQTQRTGKLRGLPEKGETAMGWSRPVVSWLPGRIEGKVVSQSRGRPGLPVLTGYKPSPCAESCALRFSC